MSRSQQYWENLSKRIKTPAETKNKRPDTSDLEVEFLSRFLDKSDEVIDIGSGSGLIVNKLIQKVKHITAVEKFEGFTKFIIDHPNVLVIIADITGFRIRKEYDAALCLGVTQFFVEKEALDIYENLYLMIKQEGLLIIRMQCGLEKDIVVDGYSEELETEYFAEYRQKEKEIELLKKAGFSRVDTFDIFPDTLNVWPDSRHFIFVCYKD